MSEDTKIVETNDDEINIWELVGHLKTGWHWLAGGCAVGLLGATGFLMLAPSKYEATAVIQPATISMISASTSPATTVEPVAQTIERLKLVTFYGDDTVKACQARSAKDLAEGVKVSIVKGNNLVSLAYRADSVALAEICMTKIVGQLSQSQVDIATPLIKELEDQRASTKQQIDNAEKFLAQYEKGLSSAPTGTVLLMLKREELMKLQKLYREQRIQLTEPLTQPMKLLEPVYASERAVSPRKLQIAAGGLTGGLFVGLLALFINRSWRRYKSTQL